MTYVDSPNKRQLHPHYEHRLNKLDLKDNRFSTKQFHKIRQVSTHRTLLKALERFGMCLNDKPSTSMPIGDLDKVCFMLINDYRHDRDYDLDVGPLNDAHLIGLNQHRRGFKVFYLYNPSCDEFTSYLALFLKHTRESLTVFYTGRTSMSDVLFKKGFISKSSIRDLIAQNCTGTQKVTFITECIEGGSIFDIKSIPNQNTNMVSLYVDKLYAGQSKEAKKSHGIFNYYFYKFTKDSPDITLMRLDERMKPSLKRFDMAFRFDSTNEKLAYLPLFH